MWELFKSGQYLYSTKARPTPETSVLIASSVLGELGWTVKTWLNTVDCKSNCFHVQIFMYSLYWQLNRIFSHEQIHMESGIQRMVSSMPAFSIACYSEL